MGAARRAGHPPQAMGLEPRTCDRSFGGAESDSDDWSTGQEKTGKLGVLVSVGVGKEA
eukprot:COSAG06_NODE_34574_length_472_cov_4.128686_1_plen_58_part_00